jgi:hypothetical protein
MVVNALQIWKKKTFENGKISDENHQKFTLIRLRLLFNQTFSVFNLIACFPC